MFNTLVINQLFLYILVILLVLSFYCVLLSQEGDDEFFQFYLLSNHSLAPFFEVIDCRCTNCKHQSVKLKEPKLTSNLNKFNLLVLGLGVHWIGFLFQVWKVQVCKFLCSFSSFFGISRKNKRLIWFPRRGRGVGVSPVTHYSKSEGNDHTLWKRGVGVSPVTPVFATLCQKKKPT